MSWDLDVLIVFLFIAFCNLSLTLTSLPFPYSFSRPTFIHFSNCVDRFPFELSSSLTCNFHQLCGWVFSYALVSQAESSFLHPLGFGGSMQLSRTCQDSFTSASRPSLIVVEMPYPLVPPMVSLVLNWQLVLMFVTVMKWIVFLGLLYCLSDW